MDIKNNEMYRCVFRTMEGTDGHKKQQETQMDINGQ